MHLVLSVRYCGIAALRHCGDGATRRGNGIPQANWLISIALRQIVGQSALRSESAAI